jgi:hypothetical protein
MSSEAGALPTEEEKYAKRKTTTRKNVYLNMEEGRIIEDD